jgi:hypothetical protein
LGGVPMFNHVGGLASRTANLEDGHSDLHYPASAWLSGN